MPSARRAAPPPIASPETSAAPAEPSSAPGKPRAAPVEKPGARVEKPETRARSDRRTAIVRVAYRLIAERGLEGLRFADVAREAGINNGTLLYYFASKDALIQAVGVFLVDQFKQSATPAGASAPMDPLAQLRWEFTDAGQRLHDQVGVVYTELLTRGQRDPAVAALLRAMDADWTYWLTSILERGRAAGVIRHDLDIPLVVSTIMAAMRGVGMLAMVTRDPNAAEPVMQAMASLIEKWVASDRLPDAAI